MPKCNFTSHGISAQDIGALPLSGGNVERLSIINTNSQGYVDLLNEAEGGTIRIGSPDNSYVYEIDAFNNHQIRMHTTTKHPSDIDIQILSWDGRDGNLYLNDKRVLTITGGGIEGDLALYKTTGTIWFFDSTNNRQSALKMSPDGQNISLNNMLPDGTSGNSLFLQGETQDLKAALVLGTYRSGTYTPYLLYGEHNKPTPSEIGAVPVGFYDGDMNSLITNGFYRFQTNANLPEGAAYGQAIISRGINSDTVAQILIDYHTPRMFFRNGIVSSDGNKWGPWAEAYSTYKKPTPAELDVLSLNGGTLRSALYLDQANGTQGIGMLYKNNGTNFNWGLNLQDKDSAGNTSSLVVRASSSQLLFFPDGSTQYTVYGQHNQPYQTLVATETTPTANNQINWVYE